MVHNVRPFVCAWQFHYNQRSISTLSTGWPWNTSKRGTCKILKLDATFLSTSKRCKHLIYFAISVDKLGALTLILMWLVQLVQSHDSLITILCESNWMEHLHSCAWPSKVWSIRCIFVDMYICCPPIRDVTEHAFGKIDDKIRISKWATEQ